MFLRALAVASLTVALVAGPASAADIHGRGPGAQASMDAMLILGGGTQRVQVLTQLCADPVRIRRCVGSWPAEWALPTAATMGAAAFIHATMSEWGWFGVAVPAARARTRNGS